MEKIKALLVFMVFWLSMFLTVSANAVSDCESIGVGQAEAEKPSTETIMMAVMASPLPQVKSCFGEAYRNLITNQAELNLILTLSSNAPDFAGFSSEFFKDIIQSSEQLGDAEKDIIQAHVLFYVVNRKDQKLLKELQATTNFSGQRVSSQTRLAKPMICRSFASGIQAQDDEGSEVELEFWTKALELGFSMDFRCGDWSIQERVETLSRELDMPIPQKAQEVFDSDVKSIQTLLKTDQTGVVMVKGVLFTYEFQKQGQCHESVIGNFKKASLKKMNPAEELSKFDAWSESCQMNLTFTQQNK